MSHIDEILAQSANQAELFLDKHWAQGRTLFGGLSAAILLQALDKELTDERPLRVVQINFIAPLLVEKIATIDVEHLRDGRNVTQMQGRILQDGQVCVQVQATYGVERESKINVVDTTQCGLRAPGKADFLPYIPKVTPRFLRHIALEFQNGRKPFTGSKESHIGGWMHFKQLPEKLSLNHIIALADSWPPTVLQMLRLPKPASTISWQIDILEPNIMLKPDSKIGYEAITRQAHGGYSHTEANIWSENRQLIMLSRQTDAVFG